MTMEIRNWSLQIRNRFESHLWLWTPISDSKKNCSFQHLGSTELKRISINPLITVFPESIVLISTSIYASCQNCSIWMTTISDSSKTSDIQSLLITCLNSLIAPSMVALLMTLLGEVEGLIDFMIGSAFGEDYHIGLELKWDSVLASLQLAF